MALLNYTTTVDAAKTLGEIQRCLVNHGARGVMFGYDAHKNPDSIAFAITTRFGERTFRLPANIPGMLAVLERQSRAGKVPRRRATPEQACRVAWRTIKVWIEAQMAFIESGMVTLDEVMLPYMLGESGRTMYEIVKDKHLALPR